VTPPLNIVLTLSSAGRPVAMNLRDGSFEPTLMRPTRPVRVDGRPWKGAGNGVVFFASRRRSRWAVRVRHWGVALLAIAVTVGLALFTLAVAHAGE